MGNLIQFPHVRKSRKAREEACFWLVSLDEGLSDTERRSLEEWLGADPSHGDVLVEMAERWDEQNVLSELAEVFPLEHYNVPPARRRYLRLAAAGVTLATIGLSWVLLTEFDDTNTRVSGGVIEEPLSYAVEGTYQTAIGEQLVVRLTDGSAVTLNTNTSLDIEYSAEERVILLHRGEASFDVAHDADRPFEVHVGGQVIRAVGTVFNVRLGTQNDIELMVNEGRVQVTERGTFSEERTYQDSEPRRLADSATELAAREMAIIKEGDATVRGLERSEIEAKLAWQRGMLIFRGEPLHSVIEDVSRYTTTKFMIVDDSIRDIRVGGYFRTDDIEGLLLALEESFGVMPRRVAEDLVVLTKG